MNYRSSCVSRRERLRIKCERNCKTKMETMKGFLFVVQLFFYTILTTADGSGWHKDSFPHPVSDKHLCGRRGVESWICDPDGVLKYDEANVLEEMLQVVATETSSGCSGDTKRPGYQVGVAVMKKMSVPSEMTKENFAEDFARHLHNKWGVGHSGCDDGALLLLSIQDRQIYISTGRTTKEKLSDDQLDIIIDKVKSSLRKEEYGKALHSSVELMNQVFSGEKLKPDGLSFYALLWLMVLLTIALGSIIYSIYKNRQYENCQEKLKRIERERNAAKNSKNYVSASCPICLEDFTPQMRTRLLLCGHKYCEPCLTKWLETNATCPICRQSTNRKDDNESQEPSVIDFFPELAFRLVCLQRQYPAFVTQDMIHHWTSRQFTDSFVHDPAFSQAKPFRPTGSGSHGSSGGFGGGSCSGGGGRGGSW